MSFFFVFSKSILFVQSQFSNMQASLSCARLASFCPGQLQKAGRRDQCKSCTRSWEKSDVRIRYIELYLKKKTAQVLDLQSWKTSRRFRNRKTRRVVPLWLEDIRTVAYSSLKAQTFKPSSSQLLEMLAFHCDIVLPHMWLCLRGGLYWCLYYFRHIPELELSRFPWRTNSTPTICPRKSVCFTQVTTLVGGACRAVQRWTVWYLEYLGFTNEKNSRFGNFIWL